MSGTHPKDELKNQILDSLDLEIKIKMSVDEASDKKLVADYNINVVYCNLDSVNKYIVAGKPPKTWLQTEVEAYEYLCKNVMKPFGGIRRLRFIYDNPTKEFVARKILQNIGGRRLVFCTTIAQAERLGNKHYSDSKLSNLNFTYHSKRDDTMLKKFINNEIDELYCVNSGSVGYTFSNVDHLVIIQSDSDKKGSTTQKLCRTLLEQGNNYKGNIWFICLQDTRDREWLNETLKSFDSNKIRFLQIKNLEN